MNQRIFHPQFKRDVSTAARYYEREQAGLGNAFRDEVIRAIDRIDNHPLSGAQVEGNVRRQMLRRFPYQIIYQVESTDIFFLTVAHQRRRPGFWRRRL